MKNLKISLTAIVFVLATSMFMVSCEKAVIETQIEEVIELSESELIATLAADQALIDEVTYNLSNPSEETVIAYVNYLETTLFERFPQLSQMEDTRAYGIVGDAIDQIIKKINRIDDRTINCSFFCSQFYPHPYYLCYCYTFSPKHECGTPC